MKNLLLNVVFLFLTCVIYAQGFEIDRAQVDIAIHPDGYFDVQEKYDVDFSESKHGIYRDIQLVYDLITEEGNREQRRIKVSKINVVGHPFSVNSFSQQFAQDLEIKIGDPDQTVFGAQHYDISYRVENAFLHESEYTQFYWNIIPPNWNTVFHEVEFSIQVPDGVEIGTDNVFVYSGLVGENAMSDAFTLSFEDGIIRGKSNPDFQSSYGESVTILVKMPKDAVKEIVPFWPFWSNYGWTLILALIVSAFYTVWYKYGKDEHVVATVSYFPPDNIDSAMAGFLIDDSADSPDLISLIPAWGAKGIIRLEEIEKKGFFGKKDTKIIRLKDISDDAPAYEKAIFNGLFESGTEILGSIMNSAAGDFLKNTLNVKLEQNEPHESVDVVLISSLKDKFYVHMELAKKHLKSAAQLYYDQKAKNIMYGTIAVLVVLGIGVAALFLFTWGIFAALGAGVVFLILLFFSKHLIRKNKKGSQMLSDLQGFKQFIKVAEQNKLKMLIEEDPNYFETTMSYALAFGLFSQWAKKFAALDINPPDWYTTNAGLVSMNGFSQSFANTMQTAQKTMVSSPSSNSGSSSGGRFSGGGFGGGGGGSW